MTETHPPESHARSVAKAVSWRVVGSMDTFVLSFLVTGNLVWAGSIASVETLTKIVLFYVHERVWRRVRWGRAGGGHARAVVKGVSWRAVGTADTFMLSWLITGHLGHAARIASFETVTKVGLFYVHEQLWARIGWGRSRAPVTPEPAAPASSAASVLP
ncbi:MAG TPA: DUF2061 domain-containing protein [Phenylobacterium sp.]